MKRFICLSLLFAVFFCHAQVGGSSAMRKEADDLLKKEHYAEALAKYQELLQQPDQDLRLLWSDFRHAHSCLQRLQRHAEVDQLLADLLTNYPNDWWLRWQVASYILDLPAYGVLLEGKFYRGIYADSGTWLQAPERNRRESLLHFEKARNLLQGQTVSNEDRVSFFLDYAAAFLEKKSWNFLYDKILHDLPGKVWRLQRLSDLQDLPDWDAPGNADIRTSGAPVGEDGNPVFFAVPASFEQAANDGERFRWLLHEAASIDENGLRKAELTLANFSYYLYGVQTLEQQHWFVRRGEDDQLERSNSLRLLETLNDDESIAQLANGQKRFHLPEDYSFIKKYQHLAQAPKDQYRSTIIRTLAQIYENRRQPEKALPWWRLYAETNHSEAAGRIEQITGNLGCFLPVKAQVFGVPLRVDFQFRNAAKVNLKLYRLDLPGILQECKRRILAGDRDNLNYHFAHLGNWLLDEKGSSFIKEKVREWEQPLEALPNHRDRISALELSVPSAGAYWLVAELPGGQLSRIPLLAEQNKLLMKQLKGEMLWQLLRADNGQPLAGAVVDLFVWQTRWDAKSKKNALLSHNLRKTSDDMGCIYVDHNELPEKDNRYWQWIATAQMQGGQAGFVCCSAQGSFRAAQRQTDVQPRTFVVTDRPIYRPGQTVRYKAWMKTPNYEGDCNPYLGSRAEAWLLDPDGEKRKLSKGKDSDDSLPELFFNQFGGISGEYQIPSDAKLGVYRLGVLDSASESTFRVEEYRKPEFAVTLQLPEEPPALGSSFDIKLQAKYYFGTALAAGQASVKVLRYEHTVDFWPPRRWDWLYGKGYWWLSENYDWYPGWQRWALPLPNFFWLPGRSELPPEVVAQLEIELDQNGEALVNIDSSMVKELYGDRDHRYEISAEVSDLSRRSVFGKGEVLVGRQPFVLRSWTYGGHYKTGEKITAAAQLSALDGSDVAGRGSLQLLRLRYNEQGLPEETLLQEWKVSSDEKGRAEQLINAGEAGQYRLLWSMTALSRPDIEIAGSSLFCVYGKAEKEGDFRYNKLELIPDKSEYMPGETLRLRINSDQAGSTVMLFTRPENGLCPRPHFIRLAGKSQEIELPVSAADIPNFYLEALLVSAGEVHQIMRSIAVPPESKALDLQVEAAASELQPGEDARLALHLRDLSGRPFEGDLVVAVYDKSVEYFTGGSNVPAILPYFWSWKRKHYLNLQSMRWTLRNSLKSKEERLRPLGIFGNELLLWQDNAVPMSGLLHKSRAVGMSAMMLPSAPTDAYVESNAESNDGGLAAQLAETTVRRNFADTAFWTADLRSDANGKASLTFPMPDSLTTWKVRIWAMGKQCQVGEAERELLTSKKLLLRLIAPRFFVEKDEVVLSAVIHQQFPKPVEVHTLLELEGDCLELLPGEAASGKIVVAANGESRVEWRVKVVKSGEALIRMKALSVESSDAVEQSFPVKVHGMQQLQPFSGVIRPEQTTGKITFEVPQQIQAGTARLRLSWSPSLALAMLDALPYLLEAPYGSSDQTLNRFLPAVLTRATLQKLGFSLQELQEKQVNLNPQELGDAAERAERNFRRSADQQPVFSDSTMDSIIAQGIADLAAMRCADGGWGWFSGWGEKSMPHLTAQVMHGLLMAEKSGVEVPKQLLRSGLNWLARYQQEELRKLRKSPEEKDAKSRAGHLDALVFKVLCESTPPKYNADMAAFLFRDKKMFSAYGKALLACGEWEKLKAAGANAVPAESNLAELLRNLRQFVDEDDENQTAWLRINPSWCWYWYGDVIETQAIYLRLLSETGEGKSQLASRLVKYLLNNRHHGTYWRSSRDTAAVVEAFSAYLIASGELASETEVEIRLDGQKIAAATLRRENFFSLDNRLLLEEPELTTGDHVVEFLKKGAGPLYFNGYLDYFNQADFLPKAGMELRIERLVYRLHRDDEKISVPDQKGQVASSQSEHYRREKLDSGAILNSGDLLEVELLVTSKNDYEYLLIEDFKAATCEAVDNRSGYAADALGAYVEYRDDRTAFLLRRLPQGKHQFKYRLKTETPGKFSALPARVTGFYAPELQGNSDEWKTEVQ